MATELTKAYFQHKLNNVVDLEGQEQVPDDELADDEDGPPKNSRGLILQAVIVLAVVMIGMYSFAMAIFSGSTLIAAGLVSMGTGAAVVHSEYRLNKMDSFRTVHNKLRKDVNVFAGENVKLTKANDELNLQVFMLKENEQRFKELAEKQNANVNDLVKLVAENQVVLDSKKKCIREDIVESLINAAFEGERSEDGELSDKEIKRLLQRMRGLPAVSVNEDALKLAVSRDRSVISLIELIRDLGIDGEQEGDRIFIIDDHDPRLLESLKNAK